MTHTFKLARRIARLRAAVAASTVLACACESSGDLISPAAEPDPGPVDSPRPGDPQPPNTPSAQGIPFGPFAAWGGAELKTGTEVFTAGAGPVTPRNLVARIAAARARRVKLILMMTGGSHSKYMRRGVFYRPKWEAAMRAFDTPEIKAAVAKGVADGTVLGASVMDEPHVHGGGTHGNTWGPPGTMTKARVDSLCGHVKAVFASLPVGTVHRHDVFEPSKSYQVCDFVVSQFSTRVGSVTAFRDGGLAMARRDRHAIMFSLNILNGGTQDGDSKWNCTGLGYKGQYAPNCQMTTSQIREYALALGLAGCGLLLWRYEPAYMSRPDNQMVFREVHAILDTAPARGCRRS